MYGEKVISLQILRTTPLNARKVLQDKFFTLEETNEILEAVGETSSIGNLCKKIPVKGRMSVARFITKIQALKEKCPVYPEDVTEVQQDGFDPEILIANMKGSEIVRRVVKNSSHDCILILIGNDAPLLDLLAEKNVTTARFALLRPDPTETTKGRFGSGHFLIYLSIRENKTWLSEKSMVHYTKTHGGLFHDVIKMDKLERLLKATEFTEVTFACSTMHIGICVAISKLMKQVYVTGDASSDLTKRIKSKLSNRD